jgi:hypothetical protein
MYNLVSAIRSGCTLLNAMVDKHSAKVCIMRIMSTGRDYGSVVHPSVIYEHGEPWWNDIDRGQFLTCPPELSGKRTS